MEVSLDWQRTQLLWNAGWSHNMRFKCCTLGWFDTDDQISPHQKHHEQLPSAHMAFKKVLVALVRVFEYMGKPFQEVNGHVNMVGSCWQLSKKYIVYNPKCKARAKMKVPLKSEIELEPHSGLQVSKKQNVWEPPWEPPWPRVSVLGLRLLGLEIRILCLMGSVIAFISPSLWGFPGPF